MAALTDRELSYWSSGVASSQTTRMAKELEERRERERVAGGVHPGPTAGEIERKMVEIDESSILGPSPLALEFILTPDGAKAIRGDDDAPPAGDARDLVFRVVIRWGAIEAFIRSRNHMGEAVWKPASEEVHSMCGLYLDADNVITIALRLLGQRGARSCAACRHPSRGDNRVTPNGVIIDLGTV